MILAADIGGTNCRLGLFEYKNGRLALLEQAWIATGSVANTKALLQSFERELRAPLHAADAVVAAIAGPAQSSEAGRLTNASLAVDFTPFNKNGRRFFLINDFIAQAYATATPIRARHIAGPETGEANAARAVIGAGTGLGHATLVSAPAWLALPSENGHTAFPFINRAENAFHGFLRQELKIPYATGEDTLAGRGLACLHRFLTGQKLTPAEVGATALQSETETLAWYSRFYGRACRNWMLATLCAGGLWIAGGIAAQNPLCATSACFKAELYNNRHWESFLRAIPVYLMEDAASGLWGAAAFGARHIPADKSVRGGKP